MSYEYKLCGAICQLLRENAKIMAHVNAVYLARPDKATPPYINIQNSMALPWSGTEFQGQEIRMALRYIAPRSEEVGGEEIHQLLPKMIENMPRAQDGYDIINMQILRQETSRTADGKWTFDLGVMARISIHNQ
ncbi:hypothetical protein LPB140_11095 [Sphingorhabdus lutea]|uniref:DUF3168 domain-containing protein n=1 Tax=Sphingorhabdus lutea TaxID=1913578 RepID=A0A1L3JDM0_9SPHN|nr:DUF3168 domain-containing protein [Sphingorhabdus lutea]APG63241.1 hypothetical protein LPB140_11095 [Sphingorhabdus lutea]